MENRSEFSPVGTGLDSFLAIKVYQHPSKRCSGFRLHVKRLSGQKELHAWLLKRNTKEIEFSWRKHLLAFFLPFHGKKCVTKKWGFPHMVKEELLPFSPLLPSNVQGDSTVMLPLAQLVSNPAWCLYVGVCPRNYIQTLCLSVAIQHFQLFSNLHAKSKHSPPPSLSFFFFPPLLCVPFTQWIFLESNALLNPFVSSLYHLGLLSI